MPLKEVKELLVLKEWTRDELAERLGIARNTLDKWFSVKKEHRRHPSPEHESKMRRWLAEAREESRNQPV